jgi:hypothetical protein
LKPGWVVPSIVTGSVIVGSAPMTTEIVLLPEPIANRISSAPGFPFASRIAWRSEPGPESLLVVTVKTDPAAAAVSPTPPAPSTARPAAASSAQVRLPGVAIIRASLSQLSLTDT